MREFPPSQGGAKKSKFDYSTRDQGPGVRDQPCIIPTASDQIHPNPTNSVAQIRPRWPKMVRGRFWFQSQDLGASVLAIGMIFRDLSVPSSPKTPNQVFRECGRLTKGTNTEETCNTSKRGNKHGTMQGNNVTKQTQGAKTEQQERTTLNMPYSNSLHP